MASLSTIRDDMATDLRTIAGLHVYDVVPDSVQAPAAVIRAAPIAPTTLDGGWTYDLYVDLYVTLAGGLRRAQDALDAYLASSGADSVLAALQADTATAVLQVESYTTRVFQDVEYLGATVTVRVWV